MKQRIMTEEAYAAHQAKHGQKVFSGAAKLAADIVAIGLAGKKKRTKHGAVKTERHGIRFDSKHEADCYDQLLLREKAGEIRNLQRQVSFPIGVNGKRVHRVVLDFWYWELYGGVFQRLIIADAKSAHTASLPAWRRAKALFEAAYGISVCEL